MRIDQELLAYKWQRNFPIIKEVLGRNDDYVKLPDGRMVRRLERIFDEAKHIAEGQIKQHSPERLTILVVTSKDFVKNGAAHIIDCARMHLADKIQISVETTEAISKTESGNLRNVIRYFEIYPS